MTRLFVLLTAACLIVGCGSNRHVSGGPTAPSAPTPASAGIYELTGTVVALTADGEARLRGARIDLSDGVDRRSALTGADGHYAIDGLKPGRWTVNISKSGYVTHTTLLDLSGDVSINFQLERDERDPRHGGGDR